jgi:hypothetical protein
VLRVPAADGQRAQRASAASEGAGDDKRPIDDVGVSQPGPGAVSVRSCDVGGATYHFCPECGSTVYWDISVAPDVVVAVGGFGDPTFPPPMISGFEAYGHPWAKNPPDLPVPHYDYDGTEHGGPQA